METCFVGRAVRAFTVAVALVCASAAHSAITIYNATLSGPAESPPNVSPGVGTATVTYDSILHSVIISVTFSGLMGTTTASHIHAATALPGTGTALVATQVPYFIAFPIGVTSGTYLHTFNTSELSFYNPAYVAANGGTAASAEAALFGDMNSVGAMNSGNAYLNIHTTSYPGGEIRGFLAAVVPEPATWIMMLLGFGGIGAAMRRQWRTRTILEPRRV